MCLLVMTFFIAMGSKINKSRLTPGKLSPSPPCIRRDENFQQFAKALALCAFLFVIVTLISSFCFVLGCMSNHCVAGPLCVVFASIGGEKLLQVGTASSTPLQVVSATRGMIHKIQTRVSECPEGPDAFTFLCQSTDLSVLLRGDSRLRGLTLVSHRHCQSCTWSISVSRCV
jgi:hypothetical protein